MPKKLTYAEFITKAQAVHGLGKYDYSETVYLPMPQKIAIRCLEHGVFMQKAGQHLFGKGCPSCGDIIRRAKVAALGAANTKWSTESFRARCLELYPHLDFSHSVYSANIGASIKYCCPVHGSLVSGPHTLLAKKAGCRKCNAVARRNALKNRAKWIRGFNKKHGSKYDYSLLPSGFVSDDKISIICPQHGNFTQKATNHLSGFGCKKCANAATGERSKLSREEYLAMFRATHGQRYNYNAVQAEFKAKDKITIGCALHGIFQQSAFEHGHGHGCPKCGAMNSGKNSPGWRRTEWITAAKGRPGFLYVIRCYNDSEVFFKAGITFRAVKQRFSTGLPYSYEEVATVKFDDAGTAYDLEKHIKAALKHCRYTPAISFCGKSECYRDSEPILKLLAA